MRIKSTNDDDHGCDHVGTSAGSRREVCGAQVSRQNSTTKLGSSWLVSVRHSHFRLHQTATGNRTMVADMTMRSAILPPSKVVMLLLTLCIQSCLSFQISHSSRQKTTCCWHQQKLSYQYPTSTQLSSAVIHRHSRPPSSQLLVTTKSEDKDCDCTDGKSGNNSDNGGSSTNHPLLLQPYLPAMDPNYSTQGPVGLDTFILSREGPPTIEELSNDQMLRIVQLECSDLEVNTLVWKCLGYRFRYNSETKSNYWSNEECFPKWKDQYPTPPDFIGMKRVYSREVDSASLRSNQALVRSIPVDNKQSLKTHLKPLGWKGYQVIFDFIIFFSFCSMYLFIFANLKCFDSIHIG